MVTNTSHTIAAPTSRDRFLCPLKVGAKLILSRVPLAYKSWTRLWVFRHSHMTAASYAIDVPMKHTRILTGGVDLSGKTCLELGLGDSVATALDLLE